MNGMDGMMPRGANASHRLPLLQLFIIFDIYPSTRAVVIVDDSGWCLGAGWIGCDEWIGGIR